MSFWHFYSLHNANDVALAAVLELNRHKVFSLSVKIDHATDGVTHVDLEASFLEG